MPVVIGESRNAIKQVPCKGCGALLEYARYEVVTINGTDYAGGPDGREYIVCPRCGKEVVLKSW